jgi:hypothetical protein
MTQVMGSHFFARDSRRSAASQPRILRLCALSVTVPCWPSSCISNVREREGAEFNLAINLGHLAAPVEEGEMHELIQRKSSQA